ncbi:putative TIGR02452 family protein [Paratrimastix pyriformis]|uniref:TIGR02452 family protein n=1 Tax=Paratrimastix pyriformis TaxID=342808 RepID=A0ABQ8UHX8_9EUKA|nr:putative TIGR02452 family protein [Paratrimastix pyriformis]
MRAPIAKDELVWRETKRKRAALFVDTLSLIEAQGYSLRDGRRVPLDREAVSRSIAGSFLCPSGSPLDFPPLEGRRTEFSVVNGDCVDAATWLKRRGFNPAILNMASANNPGGGVRGGAGAQEENLCRRSTLFKTIGSLNLVRGSPFYPLPELGGVYSPDIVFFRGNEERWYPLLENPQTFGVISVAAYSHPAVQRDRATGQVRLAGKCLPGTRAKIASILTMGLRAGHDALVLSAFGCGAYHNPPRHMAELFREALEQLSGRYRHVCFAIIDDHNAGPDGNFAPFRDVFADIASCYPTVPQE